LGWYGFGFFKDAETTARVESWHYTTVSGVGAVLACHVAIPITVATPISFSLRGAVGQAGTTMTTATAGGIFIDEIKQ
jgi:hypothetical protein